MEISDRTRAMYSALSHAEKTGVQSAQFHLGEPGPGEHESPVRGVPSDVTRSMDPQLSGLLVGIMNDVIREQVALEVERRMGGMVPLTAELVDGRGLAAMLGISIRTLNTWTRRKPEFPQPLRLGRRLMWRRVSVERYLATREGKTGEAGGKTQASGLP